MTHLRSKILLDLKRRAEAERNAGGSIEITYTLPTIAMKCSDGSDYFFQGEEAENLLAEVPANISPEDFILASAQSW